MKPRVKVLGLGGTIAMVPGGDAPGVQPSLTADHLVAAVPQMSEVADVDASSFRQVPGAHLSIDDLIALAAEVDAAFEAGFAGIVVTQGTDTIEETAFALDLLVKNSGPVVVTGAMRNPSLPGADGPANLLASVQVAAADDARDLGPVVVFNDEIHDPKLVRKADTSSPAAFRSPPGGPLGRVSEGRVRVWARRRRPDTILLASDAPDTPVALLKASLDDDGRIIDALADLGYAGLVLEALGAGHVPTAMVSRLHDLALKMPVILASRTGSGEIFRETYGFPGSEIDLLQRGLIPAGLLDGPKSRILLTLLLRAGADRQAVAQAFEAVTAS